MQEDDGQEEVAWDEPDYDIYPEWRKWHWAVVLERRDSSYDEVDCKEMTAAEATDLETHLTNFLPTVYRGDGWTRFLGPLRPAVAGRTSSVLAGAIRLLNRVRARLEDLASEGLSPEERLLRNLTRWEAFAVEALRETRLVLDGLDGVYVVPDAGGGVLDGRHRQVDWLDPEGESLRARFHSPDEHFEVGSVSWLAINVLDGAEEVRVAFREIYRDAGRDPSAVERTGRAFARALAVGQSYQALFDKKDFEKAALSYLAKNDRLRRYNESKRGQIGPQAKADAEAVEELVRTKNLSHNSAAVRVAKKRNVTASAVTKNTNKVKKREKVRNQRSAGPKQRP